MFSIGVAWRISRWNRNLSVLLAAITCLWVPAILSAGQPDQAPKRVHPQGPAYVPGEVLVLLSADAKHNGKLDGAEAAIPGKVTRRMSFSKGKQALCVQLPPTKSVDAAIAENWRKGDSRIIAVEPNYIVHALNTPDDSLYPQMWGLNNTGQTGGTPGADIDAPEAWDTTTGSSAVIVAVIDTGIDYLHPDLAANMWHNPGESGGGKETNGIDDDGNGYIDDVYGYDFVLHDNDPSDAYGHGTHVAGTIGATGNNGLGTIGVNWQCKIMACRFLDANGSGTDADAITAINYAVANGAKVLSNSWGGGGYSATLEAAIVNARDHGVLFVAAAGNSASDNGIYPSYPASYNVSNVISVAATTYKDELAYFSSFGAGTVHLGAPGDSVLSTVPHYQVIFSEDFQGATPPGFTGTQMTLSGPVNRWGTAASTASGIPNNIAAQADFANASPYLGGSDGSIVTPPINTLGLRGLTVSFLFQMDVGAGDSISVDVWNGSSWISLQSLTYGGLFINYYFYENVEVPDNIRGPDTQFRWRWITNNSDNTHQGFEIDYISVQSIGGDYSNAYALYSGTSMATPHVSGVAALMLAADPTLSLDMLRYRVINSGDLIPALAGKTITGRRLNANKALHSLPPLAFDRTIAPNAEVPVNILLKATDDGVPNPLTYSITSLPTGGTLTDPGAGPIAAVPYTLASNGNTVSYTSTPGFHGADSFQFKASDGGTPPDAGDSNTATITIAVLDCLFFDDFPSTSVNLSNWLIVTSGMTIDGAGLDEPSPPYSLRFDGVPSGSDTIASKAIDLAGRKGMELRFWYEQGAGLDQPDNGDDLIVEYFSATNGWQELTRLLGGDPTMISYAESVSMLPPDAYHAAFQFRIHNVAQTGVFDIWFVDDICVQPAPQVPPTAANVSVAVGADLPVAITLSAADRNDDPLAYIITSLPTYGTISDPGGSTIATVPYTLLAGGKVVNYSSAPTYVGPDGFHYHVNDGNIPPTGGDSNDAVVTIAVVDCKPAQLENPSPADAATGIARNTHLTWAPVLPPHNTITFDEVPYGTVVNGMIIGNITFGFSSSDATIDGGPGTTLYVDTPNIEGDRNGTLTMTFATPVAGVSYGFVLSSFTDQTSATTMTLYDTDMNELGTFSADAANHGFSYVEGSNTGTSATGIAKAVIIFTHPGAVRFAFDNVTLTPLPGQSAAFAVAATSPSQPHRAAAVPSIWWTLPETTSDKKAAILPDQSTDAQNATGSEDVGTLLHLPDLCTAPQLIVGSSPITITAAGTGAAGNSPSDPVMGCGYNKNANTLWYQIIPAQSATLKINTCGSDYDTVVAVWTGTCSTLTNVGCNDDSSCGLASYLSVPVIAGKSYLIEVAQYASPGGGDLIMTLTGCDAVCATPTTYDVYLDTTNPPTTRICQNLAELSCTPPAPLHIHTTYYWKVTSTNCCGTTTGPVWSFTTSLPPDFDHDGDVDQDDFAHFQTCLSKTGVLVTDPLCLDTDLNGDVYVDQSDLSLFLKCMKGADQPVAPACY